MAQKIKPAGVIFDFDGVVVDSLAIHLAAWQVSYKTFYGEELVDTVGLAGRSTIAIAEILSIRAGRPTTAPQLAEMKREVLKGNEFAIKLLPGAHEAFQRLSAGGIPFGIASNAPRSFIENTLARLDIKVPHLFGSDDVAHPKPAPDVFLKCARELQISVLKHPQIIVFEDSPHGLRAAVKAGMFPIGILTQNKAEDMLTVGARAVCKTIAEAIERGWLEGLPS